MNDKMQELYAKACLDARDIHPTDVPAFIACMAENFSQLMIAEFSDIVKETSIKVAQTAYSDGEDAVSVQKRVAGTLRVLEIMRERFKD